MAITGAISPELKQEIEEVEQELHKFESKQASDTNSLKAIVYPALIAFVILASYGFYLIQSLTTDVHRLTNTIVNMQYDVHQMSTSVAQMQAVVKNDMDTMVQSLTQVSNSMSYMNETTQQMTYHLVGMTTSTDRMADDVQQMNASTQNMAVSMYNLQGDMGNINRSFSSPFKMMSNFMPFSGGNRRQYVPPPFVTYYPQQGYYSSWLYNGVQTPTVVASSTTASTATVAADPLPVVNTTTSTQTADGLQFVPDPSTLPAGQSHSASP